ncbi:MAG: nucleotidyltransferase [Nitrospirae bacterium CG_4_10_14_0_8_um_filter_41_23]|jgi:predicted nucleotidyltransferase|nr:nucleotidyltransferase family protein [Nitrospirota bacterium]OHE55820.1 MAG: nucleotidyltransferase [Thermodesulfovibrio sp. RBG_19FT_COMBO_41_18]OIP60354.1 MAG: nucleotidyltransferase [Nitrospirae bacterium CG2_30_41_42]PIQ94936.1 MAG: nucleotidyltransferase [Nitrospirae bacterium CG11_big_fil_rev_8_21_14_0_20_41_14]PIV44082.1 MAG: nucleotidyltransferase [Nitrospirae bacterium CG02_land_8_20_14_3_00_41_53]PIW86547.1 MAG: nucleotidyltransferase [Nitrospirae bacterium CG_4_8_14_3_um_filter_
MKKAAITLEEVKKILKEHKAEVSRKYRVNEIGIFGSFVRGEQKNRSDIDILVEFEPRNIPGLIMLSEMERYLQRLLKKKVDVVIKSGIRPELKKGILKEVVYI